MAKKARHGGRKRTTKKKAKTIARPDTDTLKRYDPTDSTGSHPDWVKNGFPDYIGAHAGHEATSVREFSHAGHVVRIITSYRVEVDGKPVRAHLSVDEDGRVYTHATPFVTYESAINLMRAVIDNYPESFGEPGGGHGHGNGNGNHHGHGHGGGHS